MITEVTEDWQKWIFESIIEGCEIETLIAIMVEKGFDFQTSHIEVNKISQSPFLDTAKKYYLKMKKRERMATVLDRFARMDPNFTRIERLAAPPFQEFVEKYVSKSRPVILQGAAEHWKAMKWDFNYLKKMIGEQIIEIQDNRETNKNFEPDKKLHNNEIKFSDFIDRILSVESSNNAYLTAYNTEKFRKSIDHIWEEIDNIGDNYLVPETIKDSCHLWIGPKGTVTPLHLDEMNILFIQIRGSKKYRMYPPTQSAYVYDTNYVYSDVNILDVDPIHSEFSKALPIEFTINEGEVLFIPAYWWHHVSSLEPSISVSLTNVNVENNYNCLIDMP